jgi:hypothetical protein
MTNLLWRPPSGRQSLAGGKVDRAFGFAPIPNQNVPRGRRFGVVRCRRRKRRGLEWHFPSPSLALVSCRELAGQARLPGFAFRSDLNSVPSQDRHEIHGASICEPYSRSSASACTPATTQEKFRTPCRGSPPSASPSIFLRSRPRELGRLAGSQFARSGDWLHSSSE